MYRRLRMSYSRQHETRSAQRPNGLNKRDNGLSAGEVLRCQRRWLGADDSALAFDVKIKIMATLWAKCQLSRALLPGASECGPVFNGIWVHGCYSTLSSSTRLCSSLSSRIKIKPLPVTIVRVPSVILPVSGCLYGSSRTVNRPAVFCTWYGKL